MELVAFLGADKENYGQVSALIKKGKWDKVIIVKSKGVGTIEGATTEITIDTNQTILDLKDNLISQLSSSLSTEFEVALSIASGTGKEHMALVSALLSIPVGIRLVVFTKEGVKYIT